VIGLITSLALLWQFAPRRVQPPMLEPGA